MKDIIRKKRLALGMTQAEVAESLGVSTPAVNRWEKGLACPDISLLPPLARLLEIDMNELFSFGSQLSEKEIQIIVNNLLSLLTSQLPYEDWVTQVTDIIDSAVLSSPKDAHLFEKLGDILTLFTAREDYRKQLTKKRIELYERAINLSPRLSSTLNKELLHLYIHCGDKENAERIIDSLPECSINEHWMHALMLFHLNDYNRSLIEARTILLETAVEFTEYLSFLASALKTTGAEKESSYVTEKRDEFLKLFSISPLATLNTGMSDSVDSDPRAELSLIDSNSFLAPFCDPLLFEPSDENLLSEETFYLKRLHAEFQNQKKRNILSR